MKSINPYSGDIVFEAETHGQAAIEAVFDNLVKWSAHFCKAAKTAGRTEIRCQDGGNKSGAFLRVGKALRLTIGLIPAQINLDHSKRKNEAESCCNQQLNQRQA